MNDTLPDQTQMWNQKHANNYHGKLRGVPSPLAVLSLEYIPAHSKVLEVGCGVGRDAVFFAEHGHTVIATDSSSVVIAQDKELPHVNGVAFEVLDIQKPLPYDDGNFDVVYANLSLHYFYDDKTREIINNLAKVLKTGGIIAFACKSKDDYRTKNAAEIEPSLYVDPDGHALRLFTTEYAREILDDDFEIVHLDDIEEEYVGRISSIVRCIGRKK